MGRKDVGGGGARGVMSGIIPAMILVSRSLSRKWMDTCGGRDVLLCTEGGALLCMMGGALGFAKGACRPRTT